MGEPDKQAEWFKIIKAAMGYTQLGLTLVAPLILCVLFAYWLRQRFHLGGWVMIVALLIGLASMVLTFYRFIHAQLAENKKKQDCKLQDRTQSSSPLQSPEGAKEREK